MSTPNVTLPMVLLICAAAAASFGVSRASAQRPRPEKPSAQSPPKSERAAMALQLQSCRVQGLSEEALCGQYETHEKPADPTSRPIALNLVVLPATTDSVLPDPLVFLAGGGVVPATPYAGFLTRAFPNLRRRRDIVLLDQRGTWGSNPLTCSVSPAAAEDSPGSDGDVLAVQRCRDSLQVGADLTAYTTLAAVQDLDDVRAWLGYETLNLYGVSYGTKVAQAYVKAHGAHVRAAVLYGVVPLSIPFQLELARSSQRSLEQVFRRCAGDNVCRAAFPEPGIELDSVLARLGRAPEHVTLTGAPEPAIVTDRAVRDLVQSMLGTARAIERIPLLIHLAYRGDYSPIARAIMGDGPPPPPGAPRGVFLSLICSAAISQFRPDDIDSATRGSFFGDAPVRRQVRACAGWPRASLPADFWQPVRSRVPVLAISGDLDPITPPAYATAVLKNWHNGRHLVLTNRSHGDVDPCITSLFESFLQRGGSGGLNTSCAVQAAPLRFATELSVPPAR